jgi:hypothetical protein
MTRKLRNLSVVMKFEKEEEKNVLRDNSSRIQKALPQHLQIALTSMAAVHIGNISYYCHVYEYDCRRFLD